MDQVKLNSIRQSLKLTLEKLLDEGMESALDLRKINILYNRMVEKCEGDKQMAMEIMKFVSREYIYNMNIETKETLELLKKLDSLGMDF